MPPTFRGMAESADAQVLKTCEVISCGCKSHYPDHLYHLLEGYLQCTMEKEFMAHINVKMEDK